MICFFDTSALIKRYIQEVGSDLVDELMDSTDEIYVSAITRIESNSAISRLFREKSLIRSEYNQVKFDFDKDFPFFTVVDFSEELEKSAIELVESRGLKTLDSIQLASCLSINGKIDYLITCDTKMETAASEEGLEIINPITGSTNDALMNTSPPIAPRNR